MALILINQQTVRVYPSKITHDLADFGLAYPQIL